MNRTARTLFPALLMAAAILAGSAIAKLTSSSPWSVLFGPGLLALAILGADALQSKFASGRTRPSGIAWFLAATCLASCALIAFGHPERVAAMLPILGGSTMTPIVFGAGGRGFCRIR